MAVQEALILLLRASSLLSGFTQVSLTHSLSPFLALCVCVRVAFSCLLSPPLSLIPLSVCFSCLSVPLCAFFLLFLVLSVPPFHLLSLSSSSLPSQDKVGYSFYYTQNGFCVSLLVWPVVFSSFFPHLSFSSFSLVSLLSPWLGCVWRARDSGRQSGGK